MNRIRIIALILTAILPHAAAGQASRHGKGPPKADPVTMRLDYAGAEALLDALERDSLSDADVDDLLRVHGLRAMVDNVTRFVPRVGVPEFRQEIRAFVRTKEGGSYNRYFQFNDAWRERSRVRNLIAKFRAVEREVVDGMLSRLNRYRPDTGPLSVTIYLVAGGVSDGFAFEDDPNSFYANLVRAGGDFNGAVLNMEHEAYHAMQIAAQQRAGLPTLWVSNDRMPPAERLLMGTLVEGTANYAADPTRSAAAGQNVEGARERYRRNAAPARVAENFALFDRMLKDIREGRATWEVVNKEGFSRDNDDRFYFVGYEMAKALERYRGRGAIGGLFAKPPLEFFRSYIGLYRKHREIRGRFSRETEEFIASQP